MEAHEKTEFIRGLVQGERFRGKVRLRDFLRMAGLSKSTYEYNVKHLQKPETPDEIRIRKEIRMIWLDSKKRYGYRKITVGLENRFGEKVNHKKVLRLMNEEAVFAVLAGHDKGYSSYRGSVGKTAPNLMKRDFHANAFLQKAGTDVTEMKFDFGKVCFSPVIDFQNDEILACSLSASPNMKMINDMPGMLYEKFPNTYNMVLHSDQGWQYQMRQYQDSLKKHGIIQSMSRKGNCLDNAKTENLFSKMKKEMYYGHENDFHSYEEVKKTVDEYVRWYNEERIVTRLGGAPVGHRSIASIPMLCYSSI